MIDALSSISILYKNYSNLDDIIPRNKVTDTLIRALASPQKEIRASLYKTLKYVSSNNTCLKMVLSSHIDVFIIKSLSRDSRFDGEKEQALKFIRLFVEMKNAWTFIPQSIVRALVALAGAVDDRYRRVSIETLCELGNYKSVSLVVFVTFICDKLSEIQRLLLFVVD